MKKSNIWLLVFMLFVGACTEKKPKALISKIVANRMSVNFNERSIAANPEGRCFKNLFKIDKIKNEIKELERNYISGQPVRGQWRHLDFASLSVPAATFLSLYGNEIGDLRDPKAIDYSGCDTIPCIFNKIYGKEDYIAGYVHYLWFLKFGNMLSADNKVPGQSSNLAGVYNNKSYSIENYLFSEDELYGIWRLSHMLKAPFTKLSYLKEIQRVPRGEIFEGENMTRVCGLSSSAGWIILNDGCLTISSLSDFGYLYQAVLHEIAHQVDFHEGRGTKRFYRSHKQDYLDVSGMFMEEFVDDDGSLKRKWALKEDVKLPSHYGGIAPQENFAEALSLFRVEGESTKNKINEEHFVFVSNNYYHHEKYDHNSLIENWLEKYRPQTTQKVFQTIINCSNDAQMNNSKYFAASDFDNFILPSTLSCLAEMGERISTDIKSITSSNEPEGCKLHENKTSQKFWDESVKSHLLEIFSKYLSEIEKDKNYLIKVKQFQDNLADKRMAFDAFVNCFEESNESSCYEKELKSIFSLINKNLNLPEFEFDELLNLYLKMNPFLEIKDEVEKSYRNLVDSKFDSINQRTIKVWDTCVSRDQSDNADHQSGPFTLSSGYMISSLYNCLNQSLPDAMMGIVRNFSVNDEQITNAKEELIIVRSLKPKVIRILLGLYERERKIELEHSKTYISLDHGKLREKLESDFSWIKNPANSDAVLSDCKKAGLRLINYDPLYHLKKDLFTDFIETQVCFNISMSDSFNRWIDSQKDVMEDKFFIEILNKVTEAGKNRADECMGIYPMNTTINKIRYRLKRESCLVDEWPKFEAQITKEFLMDPLAIKFKIDESKIKLKLLKVRRKLQLAVMKEMYI